MLKKVLLFVCSFLITTTCYAYKDTIDGFRGITWGTSVDEVENSGVFYNMMGPKDKLADGSIIYGAKFTVPNLFGVHLERVNLGFRDDKLTSIGIFYEEDSRFSSYSRLVYSVTAKWGKPIEDNTYICEKSSTWRKNSELIIIDSHYNAIADEYSGMILIFTTKR